MSHELPEMLSSIKLHRTQSIHPQLEQCEETSELRNLSESVESSEYSLGSPILGDLTPETVIQGEDLTPENVTQGEDETYEIPPELRKDFIKALVEVLRENPLNPDTTLNQDDQTHEVNRYKFQITSTENSSLRRSKLNSIEETDES